MGAFNIPESGQHFVAGNVAPSTDRAGTQQVSAAGVPLWEVRVMALPEPEPGRDRVPLPEVLRVQVPTASQPEVSFGQPVAFSGLVVRTWSARDGRMGLMYSADAVRPVVSAPSAERPRLAPGPVREQQ
jgi:hypothetical protein